MKPTPRLLASLVALALSAFHPRVHAQTTATLTTLYSFSHAGETASTYALAQGMGGNLFGVTTFGGENEDGTVFQLTTSGVLTTIYSFDSGGADGYEPSSALILGSDGNLYGTTDLGGTDNEGTVYRITQAGALKTLHGFDVADGYFPSGTLAVGKNGNFYGTTVGGGSGGGQFGHGTVFEMTPGGSLLTRHSFTSADGAQPGAGVVRGSDGDLYGTTPFGGTDNSGTVFQIIPANGFKTLYNFTGGDDGGQPAAGLVERGAGNFYGTTKGGANGDGTVFFITRAGGAPTTVYTFDGSDGRQPSVLVLGNDGNFYGTTEFGGMNDEGTVFQLTPDGHLTTLIDFNATDANGIYPASGLLLASDGFFYGTTAGGKVGNTTVAGTVYKLDVHTAAGTVVFSAKSYSVNEAAGSRILTVRRIGSTNGAIFVDYSEADGTALAGTDYKSATGRLTWADGDAADKTFAVTILNRHLTSGMKTFTVKLTPVTGGGSVGAISTASVNILDNDPAPPVITSATMDTAFVDKAFTYQIEAANGATSYGVGGLFAGITVNKETGLISGTPTGAGTHTLTLQAANAGGTGTAMLALKVLATPSITSKDTAAATVGKTFSYQITATNDPTSFGVGGLFKGITVNQTTGLISGTPTAAGTHSLDLRAANAGGTGDETLTLTVKNP